MELLDICDARGNPTGQVIERETAHATGAPHRTAHIWILRERDGNTEVLMQKRSREKDSFPGMYDTSSAGHLTAGDAPLAGALRELREETGLTAAPEDLTFIGNFTVRVREVFHGKPFLDNETVFVYVYTKPVTLRALTLQPEEIESAAWFPLEDVYAACLRGGDGIFCVPHGGLELVRRYLSEKRPPRMAAEGGESG